MSTRDVTSPPAHRADRLSSLDPRVLLGVIGFLCGVIVFGGGCLWWEMQEDRVTIRSFSPLEEVEPGSNFTITFSKPLVSDSLVNLPADGVPVTIRPELPGRFEWIAPDRLRFYPEVKLAPATAYTFDISPRIAAESALTLRGERTFTVSTPPLRVRSALSTFEYDPTTNTHATLVASIEFNYAVDPAEAAEYVRVEDPDGNALPVRFLTTEPGTILKLEAPNVPRGEEERRLRLRVSEGLKPVGGTLGLAEAVVEPVLLPGQEDLKVEEITPLFTAGNRGTVRVAFNIPVDPERAAPFITVDPGIDVRVTASHLYLSLNGAFLPDSAYTVTVKEGLPAIDGTKLVRTVSTSVRFLAEDIEPQIDFAGSGFYLSRSGPLKLGVATINVDEVDVTVEKVFENNLVHLVNTTMLSRPAEMYWYYDGTNMAALGTQVASFDLDLTQLRNQEVVTPIDLEPYIARDAVGIYRVTARHKEQRWISGTRWVVATNIGLVAKRTSDALWVWASNLHTLDPVAGAELRLYSQNNQTLATAQTDAEGLAVFENLDAAPFPPYFVTAKRGVDLSFLELDNRRIPTSDFDVGGLPALLSGYDAYLYNERGIYRPGETAHLAAVVRGPQTAVPPSFPVRLQVYGPDSRLIVDQRAVLDDQGMTDFAAEVPDFARTGRYTARLMLADDRYLGSTSFSVEEFIPDRMKVALDSGQEVYRAGEELRFEVEGVTLFGPPAAGRNVEAALELEPFPFTVAAYPGFTFSDPTRSFSMERVAFDPARLDDEGRRTYTYTLPSNVAPPSALRGVISATVLEPGGRGVTAYRGVVVHPYRSYVGLRSVEEGYATPDRPRRFQMLVVDTEGNPIPGHQVEVTLHRIYYNSILKRVDGRYRYVSERVEDLESRDFVQSAPGPADVTVTPNEYGSYRITMRDVESGAAASYTFYASGWGYVPWAMDAPERIEIDFDKERYRPGDRARVQLRAPFPGKLLFTIERDGVFEHRIIRMPENTATIEVEVDRAWQPNVYATAHLVRSTRGLDRDTPVRAFGTAPLLLDTEDRRLAVRLDVPDVMRPRQDLTVDVHIPNAGRARPTITLAAIDEGILQLTDFQTPDPLGHFFGKKRLSVSTADLYDEILPEISPRLSSPAGDIETARKRQLSPQTARRVKPVAFWSGLVETDGNGRARVQFPIPAFNGTVRVMAVAALGGRFGSAAEEVIVRDPIVLTPTFPRVIGSSDELRVPVSVFNGTGRSASINVTLEADGPVEFEGPSRETVTVGDGEEAQLTFRLRARQATGPVQFRVRAEGGGIETELSSEVVVRPPVPLTTVGGSGSARENEPATFTLPADFVEGSTRYAITVSGLPAVRYAGSLQYLLRYPHGNLENTVSRAFPLLYFGGLARQAAPDLFRTNSSDYYVDEAISKIESLQLSSGAFSFWPNGGYSNDWASIYTAHFLVEARRAGYAVTDRVYDRMLDALRGYTRQYRGADDYAYQPVVYAAYVLALAGHADRATMNFVKDNVLDRLSLYSQYQLAGAYAHSGDAATALALLPRSTAVSDRRDTGGHFNSPDRARAIALDVLAEVNPRHPAVPELMRQLSDSYGSRRRWYDTQTNAYALLALGKILAQSETPNFAGSVEVDGRVVGRFDEDGELFASRDWRGSDVTIGIQGTGTAYFTWTAEGLPSTLSVDEYDRDLIVRRRYLRENGTPIVDLSNVRQGELVIAEISIRAPNRSIENVAIVDLLPTGFEIENPRLESRQNVSWIGEDTFRPEFVDMRDDRMLVYGDVQRGTPRKFYYGVRAVTAGTFRIPPIRAEAMYAPEIASVASSGRLTIRPAGSPGTSP